MASSIITAPPSRTFSDNHIWCRFQTDTPVSNAATVVLTFSSTGPSNTDTLTIEWDGNSLPFYFSSSNTESPYDLPLIGGGESLSDYVDRVAERLAANEVLNSYFAMVRSTAGATELITITQRTLALVDITAAESATNLTVSSNDVTSLTAADALRLLVHVYSDTDNVATDQLLISLHVPYELPDAIATLDISPAFSALGPHLPTESSIAPVIFISLLSGAATSSWMLYYIRHADKSGTPAVAGELVRTSSYYAVYGALAADSKHSVSAALRHAYQRRDGEAFEKPITPNQPDWMYWVCPTGVTQVYMQVQVYWSDGTESTDDPFGTTGITVEAGKMYWFGSGYRQLKVQNNIPSGGTDPDAYIIGYRAQIRRTDGFSMLGTNHVKYFIQFDPNWEVLYLLFDNGVGGCESVCFLGKKTDRWVSDSEEYSTTRDRLWTNADGDFGIYNASGRRQWEVQTGWYADPYYIEHLRQLPLTNCWLIDTANQKFRKVIVEPGEIEISTGDDTLYNLPFTIRAAWKDSAANV